MIQEIIEMAKEAGLRTHIPFWSDGEVAVALEAFANLVAAKEREACAQVCEELKPFGFELKLQRATADDCAPPQTEQTNIERHETNVQKFLGAPQPEQEPVATLDDLEQEIYENTRQFVSRDVMEWMLKRYYTTPPQRTWVGLTDEEIGTIAYNVNPLDGIRQFSRAIEAKLKQKNGYAEEKNT